MKPASPWFWSPRPIEHPTARLFCFPFACGGTLTFRLWPEYLPPSVEVVAIQLPGRERRYREPPYRRMAPLVDALLEAMGDRTDVPSVFFGHSMGALIAFELARALRRRGSGASPVHLLASGRRAPQMVRRASRILHTLPRSELILSLRKLGGTPAAVFDEPDLLEMVLGLARADFELVETYRYRPGEPLACPITTFRGADDPEVTQEEAAAWAEHTSSDFSLHVLPGNHFFIHDAMDALLETVARVVS